MEFDFGILDIYIYIYIYIYRGALDSILEYCRYDVDCLMYMLVISTYYVLCSYG